MPEDRRADYRAYDLVRRHELEVTVRLLEEILPEMPKPRGWSHQPHVGRPGPHRRGRPARFPWEPMAKALGLMHAMGWDYRQAEGTLWVASDLRRQMGLDEAPSRMTLWKTVSQFPEERLRVLLIQVLPTLKNNDDPIGLVQSERVLHGSTTT